MMPKTKTQRSTDRAPSGRSRDTKPPESLNIEPTQVKDPAEVLDTQDAPKSDAQVRRETRKAPEPKGRDTAYEEQLDRELAVRRERHKLAEQVADERATPRDVGKPDPDPVRPPYQDALEVVFKQPNVRASVEDFLAQDDASAEDYFPDEQLRHGVESFVKEHVKKKKSK